MEALVNPDFWRNRRVFLTGHTGFKGSWLSLWLQHMGAEVDGYALSPPTQPAMFEICQVARNLHSTIGDIRDVNSLSRALHDARPDIVFHLAAQPLVLTSFEQPLDTFDTNVMGTANLLEAVRNCNTVRAVVVISSDKCYENREQLWGYREPDPMGGHDPYSASKGCTELLVACYRKSFLAGHGVHLASARAGNVIGGGDWAANRLVPDVLRAFTAGRTVELRHPSAIRPWQHVLEPLSGYLLLAERLCNDGAAFAEGWNFGPEETDAKTVAWIVERLAAGWGPDASWTQADRPRHHEAHTLKLDCSKARTLLGWHPRWHADEAITRSLAWYQAWRSGADMYAYTLNEITAYSSTYP